MMHPVFVVLFSVAGVGMVATLLIILSDLVCEWWYLRFGDRGCGIDPPPPE